MHERRGSHKGHVACNELLRVHLPRTDEQITVEWAMPEVAATILLAPNGTTTLPQGLMERVSCVPPFPDTACIRQHDRGNSDARGVPESLDTGTQFRVL